MSAATIIIPLRRPITTVLESVNEISELVAEDRPLNILDIGTGAGATLINLARMGHNATGITLHDFRDDERFDETTAQLGHERITYIVDDAHNLDTLVESGTTFDCIFSSMTMYLARDPLLIVKQSLGHLAPHGKLVFDDLGLKPGVHDLNYQASQLIDELASCGFDPTQSRFEEYGFSIIPLVVYGSSEADIDGFRVPYAA